MDFTIRRGRECTNGNPARRKDFRTADTAVPHSRSVRAKEQSGLNGGFPYREFDGRFARSIAVEIDNR